MEPLLDRFGRRHNSLRVSVTDRCNLRCTYCMPESVEFQPQNELLTFEELTRFVRIASTLGVDKVRITGGEPLLRREVSKFVAMVAEIEAIRDISLTTNGVLLARHADELFQAGLRRINISLDTLDRSQFAIIARRDSFDQVLEGIESARQAGFEEIKINAVAAKGVTDIVGLARFCRDRGLTLRYIEFMPLEADQIWSRDRVLTADEIVQTLAEAGIPVEPIRKEDPSAPADEYRYVDGRGRLGIIASVSKPFCGDCNRIRITADGHLRNCLFAVEETDIRGPMRAGASDELIAKMIRQSVSAKWEGHQINQIGFVRPTRMMHSIGG